MTSSEDLGHVDTDAAERWVKKRQNGQSSNRVTEQSLRHAHRRLTSLEDIMLEDEGTVPPWLTAAREAVLDSLEEVSDE